MTPDLRDIPTFLKSCAAGPVVSTGMADKVLGALRTIARGRTDCGRALAAEKARQIARECLVAIGEDWRPGTS
jgi:ABC-type arginine transport system permease subunit